MIHGTYPVRSIQYKVAYECRGLGGQVLAWFMIHQVPGRDGSRYDPRYARRGYRYEFV